MTNVNWDPILISLLDEEERQRVNWINDADNNWLEVVQTLCLVAERAESDKTP